jgi:hypothetical protein
MRILAHEPDPDPDFVHRHTVEIVAFERLLAEADFLTLHVPLTAETRHLINRRTLALMKRTAFLINTARGPLVCEADLAEALAAGNLAGAGPTFSNWNLRATVRCGGVRRSCSRRTSPASIAAPSSTWRCRRRRP